MFQTGFDEPMLHTMYVDKKLGGLQGVQTLSRLNRTMSGKTDTFVLDFVNAPDDIQESFQPYYEGTILTEETDPNRLYSIQQEIEKHNLFRDDTIERFVTVFYDESIPDEQLQGILDTVVDGIITIDAAGVIQTFNAAATRIFGYAPDQVIGKNVRMLMPEPYKGEHDGFLNRFLATGEARVIGVGREVFGQRKDGTVFPMSLAVGEMPIAGKPMFAGVARDITDLKAVEGLKNEFVSTVSHELRTPLTSIKGALGLVRSGVTGDLPERMTAMLEIAYSNSDRLIRLINDILDIEKIEAGKMVFRMDQIDLPDIVAKSVEANRTIGEHRNVVLIFEEKPRDATVNADGDRLTQIVANLLSNAVKFSPAGGTVKISVTTHNGNLRVSVADDGPGVPDEFRERIFEKFSQADSTDTRGSGGTGLGLSICKAIIEHHGGKIGFASKQGEGATFFFDLPPFKVEIEAPAQNARNQNVLICEDEPEVAEWLRLVLNHGGFKADVAKDAETAAVMLEKKSYVAMTLDLNLPGKDGLAFIKDLRAVPATQDLPIVVVSIKPPTDAKEINGDSVNVVDWIQKPVDTDRLLRAIKRARSRRGGLPQILHVEDDSDLCEVVAGLVGDHAVVTSAETFSRAKDLLENHWFDLVLLDLDLSDRPGQELLPLLSSDDRPAGPPVIVFSASEVSRDLADSIYQALVKSQTSNEELLASVLTAIDLGRGIPAD